MANLEQAKYSMGQLMGKYVDPVESTNAMNAIFPPSFFGYGQSVLDEAKMLETRYNREMEDLVNKFSKNTAASDKYKQFSQRR